MLRSEPRRQPGCPSPRPRWSILWLGLLSGLLLAVATAQVGFGLVAFVALVPLLLGIDAGARPGAAAAAGWLAGLLLFGCALFWVPLAGFRGVFLTLVAAYVAFLALSLALFAGVLAWLRRRHRALFFAATPVVWITVEFLRSSNSLGYPWHHLGYALSAHPDLIQLAALGGLYALSLWIVAVNTLLTGVGRAPRGVFLLLAALLAGPLALGLRSYGAAPQDPVRVAAVQPGLVEMGRTVPERFHANLRTLLDLTDEAIQRDPELVVWPESAFERLLWTAQDPFLGGIAHHYGTPLLTGARRLPLEPGARPYNSAVLARPDGTVALAGDKVRPVLFWEGAPASVAQRALARVTPWPGRFKRGDRSGLIYFARPDGAPVPTGILICVDSSYPALVRDLRRRGARLLVEISNEAHTGEWSAVQHALVSRVRAVEGGAPLVRVANTGPTEWIDRHGRVVARLGPGSHGTATAALALAGDPTPYVLLGDAPVFAAGMLPLLVLGLRRSWSCLRPSGSSSTHRSWIKKGDHRW